MIRLRDRTRWCVEVTHVGSPTFPGMPNPNIRCWRRIGWWASWWIDRCHQHRDGGAA